LDSLSDTNKISSPGFYTDPKKPVNPSVDRWFLPVISSVETYFFVVLTLLKGPVWRLSDSLPIP
jgi:hypothetical protein